MILIYGLIDPKTNEIRYIGKTSKSLEKRLKDHLVDAKSIMNKTSTRRKINKRYSWIISLFKDNLSPNIKLIEEVNESNWEERESYWISIFPNLTNMTKGGDGGDTNSGKKFGPRTLKQKEIISIATKEGMKTPSARAGISKGAKAMLAKTINADGTLRKDIVEKIREGSKKKINIKDCNNIVKTFKGIESFLDSYNLNYYTFKKLAIRVDWMEFDIDQITLNNYLYKTLK